MFATTEIHKLKLSLKILFYSVFLRQRRLLKLRRCYRGKREDNFKELKAADFLFLAFKNENLLLFVVKLCLEQ